MRLPASGHHGRRRLSAALPAAAMLAALAILSFATIARAAPPATIGAATAPAVPVARVIVQYRDGSTAASTGGPTSAGEGRLSAQAVQSERAARLATRMRLDLRGGRSISERQHVVFARGMSSEELAARLAAQPEVEFAEPDRRMRIMAVPNDPRFGSWPWEQGGPEAGQWYLKATDAAIVSAIDAVGAWGEPSAGATPVVVAVLDTGVRFDHPDLPTPAQGMLPGYDFVSPDGEGNFGTAGDGDGRDADASDPGDFLTRAEAAANPTAFPPAAGCFADVPPGQDVESSWHGTQVTGLVAAVADNARGMAGLGRQVRLLPVRVLGKCGGYTSDIAAAIRWAAGLDVPGVPTNGTPAKVINLSLGGLPGACGSDLREAVNAAIGRGAVVVAAAGNQGVAAISPANCPGVIGVAGLRHTGTKVGYSALGPTVSIAAPAGNCVEVTGPRCLYPILSTTNSGRTTPVAGDESYTNGLGTAAFGTSFSTPLATGVAALMLSVNPALAPADVRALLQGAARRFPAAGADPATPVCQDPAASPSVQDQCHCTTSTCGAGMLDARGAVAAAASGVVPRIAVQTPVPQATVPVQLSAADSTVAAGRTIASYQWSLVDGQDIVTLAGDASGPGLSVTPTAPGRFTVTLTVTDNTGGRATSLRSVDVAAAPAPADSGGGGAFGLAWLAAVLAAAAALRRASWRLT